MLITPEYRALQEQLHQRGDYGLSGARHCHIVEDIAQKLQTRDILDYGCGQCTLQKGLPFPIQNYDPCIAEHAARPTAADIVVCTDVLEHIEPECLEAVLQDLFDLTREVLFVNVACRPARKFLADGRNAHLIQEQANWWLKQMLPLFDLASFQVGKGEFTAIFTPIRAAAEQQ